MSKPEKSISDVFIQMLTTHQPHLRGYILASVGSYAHCEDIQSLYRKGEPVLQE